MSLDLDARQRAMLEEMHIHVWWPKAAEQPAEQAAVASVPPTPAVLASAPSQPPRPQPRTAPVSMADAMADAPELAMARAPGPQPAVQARAAPSGPIDSMDWATLQEAVAGCMACALGAGRKNAVFGVGPRSEGGQPPRADWLIVGESPGEDAEAQGEPFVGESGKLLDNMLKAIGVSRHGSADGLPHKAACIVNLLKCRPPGNRNPAAGEVAQCEPYLRRQVALLQPKVIIAMGRLSVHTLLAESVPDVAGTPLGRLRGQVHQYHGVPVVVTYHPAYLLRSLPEKAKAWADLVLALDVWKKRTAAERLTRDAAVGVQAELG